MKQWSLGYEIVRLYVRLAFWLTHKQIVVTGQHLIPKGKPIIFAPNHQNALMDPLALVCTNPLQVLWLARADIFKSKLARPILKFFKMLPVYRIRDGKDNLSNNEQIFALVTRILESRQSVALFPEAAHSGRRQMLPHKKAIPRIALEAEAKNNFELHLQIVPVGIYYSHYWWFNRTLIVRYGEPISIDSYKNEYRENQQKALLSLRDEIYENLLPLTLNIGSEPLYSDYENMRQIAGKQFAESIPRSGNKTLHRFLTDRKLVEQLEKTEKGNPEKFLAMTNRCRNYFDSIHRLRTTDEEIVVSQNSSFAGLTARLIGALIILPFFLAGFIFNALPFFIPREILRRKVKNTTFLSTFNFVVGLIVYPLFYFVQTVVIFVLTQSGIIALVSFFLMPFVGKLAWEILLFYRRIYAEIRLLLFSGQLKAQLKAACSEREKLAEMINESANA